MPPNEQSSEVIEASSFSLHVVFNNLDKALVEERDVKLVEFIKAYEELNKFIGIMGKIFQFVKLDVNAKIGTLTKLIDSNTENYETVNAMLYYEHKLKKKPGSTAFLGLHRALEFIVDFLQCLIVAKDEDNVPQLCRQSYEKTLSRFHAWMVRKAVDLASYTLPNRRQLIDGIQGVSSDDEVREIAICVIERGQSIYKLNQLTYDELKLNNLL
ncbi:unnamed protein product [Auanema sp. JU1783]|nr:unnamed protein product [Auanema sp. JU1783]